MNTFKISPQTATPDLTKRETELLVPLFGLSVLEWRRLTDAQAGHWFTALLARIPADAFYGALARVRRLAGRDRGFWLTSISVVDPGQSGLLKNPPPWTDDETWQVAFMTFCLDELRKLVQQIEAARTEQALQEQL